MPGAKFALRPPSLALSYIGSVSARHSSSSSGYEPSFAALSTERHLYSAGRPSCWALAHVLVGIVFCLLHFARGVAKAKCILVTAVCLSVCLSALFLSVPRRIATLLHGRDVTWGMVGLPSSCALLGEFCNRCTGFVALQLSAEREMSASACTRFMPGVSLY